MTSDRETHQQPRGDISEEREKAAGRRQGNGKGIALGSVLYKIRQGESKGVL